MSTTSTVPAVVDALLAALAAVGVDAFEAWPATDAKPEMLILGEVAWDDYAIATIKSGRKHRQEDWSIDFEIWELEPKDTTPAEPKAARDRAFAMLATIEDVLAADVTAGTDFATVQWVEIRPESAGPRVFEKGWAYRVAGRIVGHARLK